MKIPEKFKTLTDEERRRYSNKKKREYEKKVTIWTEICRKLSTNKDFTPLEMDEVNIVLEKEYPTVKDYSGLKIDGNNGYPKLVKK